MNELEQQLSYPLGDTLPETGHSIEVAPGIRWLRMPLPFALDHINLWLLRERFATAAGTVDGWTIVDCGIGDDITHAAWEQVFANDLGGLPVLRVVVTHMHPDHVGAAHWLTERWSTPEHECRLWMSAGDFQGARAASRSLHTGVGSLSAGFATSHGITDEDALEKLKQRAGHYARMVPQVPERYRRMIDGDGLTIGPHEWRCMVGYGHAPEHISLYSSDAKVLIAGDMMLPRISTNIGVTETEPEGNPLVRYLDSIERLRALPAETLVLPSHGRPFTGLHTRIDQLQQHHRDRLAEVIEACAEAPQTAADLLPVLFKRKLDLHQTTFAMGESLAHLNALWLAGRLGRQRDAAGVYRFTTLNPPSRPTP
jgi:glyoxylase-like metal-dependent hydrolase (beta-lactamase superfamily II)